MAEFTARSAAKDEIRGISDWFLEERSKYPGMAQLIGGGLRGIVIRNIVTPRYLRRAATTLVLEQDGQMAGFAAVEQRGQAVYLAEFATSEGYDRAGLMGAMLAEVERLAREREYVYVRATPWDSSEAALAPFYQAGFQLLDYYLSAFTGRISNVESPSNVMLAELPAAKALERRLYFLRQEMDASQVAGRDLIEDVYLPKKPSKYRAYRIDLADPPGGEPREVGYLAPRPNERDDGVLTLAISLAPEFWGSEVELKTIGGYASEAAPDQEVRVLISTSPHADRAEEGYRGLGLARAMDLRPVVYKNLRQAG